MKLSLRYCLLLILIALLFNLITSAQSLDASPLVRYWHLSTGSDIAYISMLSENRVNFIPVIFLHGGPGASQVSSFDLGKKWYEHLAALGFDIYVYDQIGSGPSGRLSDPCLYSMERHIEDLEAIRKITGSDKVILIGDSWGATLAANYIARYPGNVIKAIFTSPGCLYLSDFNTKSKTPRLAPEFLDWIKVKYGRSKYQRYLKLDTLIQVNLQSAYSYAGDKEMDKMGNNFLNDIILKTTVFNQEALRKSNLKFSGTGWWSMTMTIWNSTNKSKSPKQKLMKNQISVLILRGDYDYLPEEIAHEHTSIFANSKYIKVPLSGHLIWLEQPGIYSEQIEKFLISN